MSFIIVNTPASAITAIPVPTNQGGTGLASFTANGVTYAPSSSALATGSVLTFDGAQLGVNAITVGRGAGAISTNTVMGTTALQANTTGSANTIAGYQAGYANTTGAANTAVGYQALYSNTTAQHNTAVGNFAFSGATTGGYNTGLGYNAGAGVSTGEYNTFLGYESGNNGNGTNVIGIGYRAGRGGGSNSVWIGYLAGQSTSNSGTYNVGLGFYAGVANTTGQGNVFMGYQAGQANTTGNENVFIGGSPGSGVGTGYANTTGYYNTGVGNLALRSNTTGINNVGYGLTALYSCTTGSNNVGVGNGSLGNLTTANGCVAIGDLTFPGYSIFNITTESDRGIFGHTNITNAYVKVAWTVTSDARDKTSIEAVPHGLSFVQQLNPVSYRWKTSREDDTPKGNRRYGFLAQEIMALEGDNPVIIDDEQPNHLKYQGEALVPVLVNAIKELSAQITALQAELATLKGN